MSKSEIIGPFLGPRGETGVEIFIALPDKLSTEELTCRLYENSNEIQSCASSEQKDIYKLFSFSYLKLHTLPRRKTESGNYEKSATPI